MSSAVKGKLFQSLLPSCVRSERDSINPAMLRRGGHVFVAPPPAVDICGYLEIMRVSGQGGLTCESARDSLNWETVENDNNALSHMNEEKVWAVVAGNMITLSHPKNERKVLLEIPLRICLSLRVLTPRIASSPKHHRRAFSSNFKSTRFSATAVSPPSSCDSYLRSCPQTPLPQQTQDNQTDSSKNEEQGTVEIVDEDALQAQHLLMLVTESDTFFLSFHDVALMYEWQTAITTSMMRN
eukprot:c15948_g1_i1.p1 GENE.c15948_g1_i1~~c15948_g1_i1.p1  ORF type:complete len:240 (+),score=34.33 c15948_g1_i1:183-902(+)